MAERLDEANVYIECEQKVQYTVQYIVVSQIVFKKVIQFMLCNS